MDFIAQYSTQLIAVVVVVAAAGIAAVKFFNLPTKEQIAKVKEVLLAWVVEAEKELGGGTGQIKLRYVYDLFVSRFPTVAKVIKFETFSLWVDEALDQMEDMLRSNKSLKEYVKNEEV